MVVAFRGTETEGGGAAADILTDLYALQVHGCTAAATLTGPAAAASELRVLFVCQPCKSLVCCCCLRQRRSVAIVYNSIKVFHVHIATAFPALADCSCLLPCAAALRCRRTLVTWRGCPLRSTQRTSRWEGGNCGIKCCTIVLVSLLSSVDNVFNRGGSYHLRW
jgi:hypothetical protein